MAENKLAAKLAEVMATIDHVEKRGRNEFQNYDYVKAADIARAVRTELAKRGVIMLQSIVDKRFYEVPAREGVMQATDLHIQFTFYDGETGEKLTTDGYGSGTDKGDKASYKAQTGALKYALRHAFLIPDESDPEADASVDKATEESTPLRRAPAVGSPKLPQAQTASAPKPPVTHTPPSSGGAVHPIGEGTVTFTESKKFGKREALSVTLANSAEKYYKCWESHQKGVPTLQLKTLISGGKNKHCKFITEESEGRDGKKFYNIIGVLAIGEREFEADGTEIIKREAPTTGVYEVADEDIPF